MAFNIFIVFNDLYLRSAEKNSIKRFNKRQNKIENLKILLVCLFNYIESPGNGKK